MNDEQAEAVALAALTLAVVVRDEGAAQVRHAANDMIRLAGGDPVAALTIAAALINVEQPVKPWWQEQTPAEVARQHGTHNGYNRHRANGEDPCVACREGESTYQRARHRRRYKPRTKEPAA